MFKKKKVEINLLPETQRLESLPKTNFIYAGFILLAVILVIIIVFAFGFLQNQQVNGLNKQITKLETEGQREVAQTAQLIARTKLALSEYKTFSSTYPDLNKRLLAFETIVPNEIILDELSMESNGKATVKGQAPNPDLINALVSSIEKDGENFKEVVITTVAKGTNQYSFGLNIVFKK